MFDKFESSKIDYKTNPFINSLIVDLSLRLPRMFEMVDLNSDLNDRLTNVLIFIALHVSNKEGSEDLMQKMFDKCSFIGRKIMIKLNMNEHKLIVILKFFVCVLSALKTPRIVKSITKQILFLVYRTYTNVKLNKSEAKTISVEIIELLQNKCGEE